MSGLSHRRYGAVEALGAGAQGEVYRVVDRERPGRALVAKVWRSGVFGEETLAGEFALLSRLKVPGLVRAHDLGRDERSGAPFLVEDFVDGPEAAAWVGEATGPARGARLSALLAQLSATLAGLHEAGFLHGDLKPAHVRVAGGKAALLDLGSAIARAGGEARGHSPGFAAPEVEAGGAPSDASDLYGLGALAWAAATGAPPPSKPGLRRGLRARAPWVLPSLADLIEALLREHPGDRPAGAVAVWRMLGHEARPGRGAAGQALGREAEERALRAPFGGPVRYLTGPSGSGKSLLGGELFAQALLSGRAARRLQLPEDSGGVERALVDYFRGEERSYPFGEEGSEQAPLLLVLDGVERAPRELGEALDVFRCRRARDRMEVLAIAERAPAGADEVALGPLPWPSMLELAAQRGAGPEAEELARAAGGNPGWLLATLGHVPLGAEQLRERLSQLSPRAVEVYAAAAAAGGWVEERWATALAGAQARAALGELLAQGLLGRRARGERARYEVLGEGLDDEALRGQLRGALRAADLAQALLADPGAPARALLSLARRGGPGEALLAEAARRARACGHRADEVEALLSLCERPEARSPAILARLERLTRDAGQGTAHPQVLGWLEEAAGRDPSLRPLALRRRAEQLARAGDAASAEALAARALEAARAAGSGADEAFALATAGMVGLFRAAWPEAHRALKEARRRLDEQPSIDDPEEAARLDHNLGVVAVYRGQVAEAVEAFERSLLAKERLGDRAGVRASLRNLGYALARAGRLDEAARCLDEALALARSLGQASGQAFCLSARAEVEVRRGAAAAAERFIAEAEALGDQAPPSIRADLSLLRAELSLLAGDGERALSALALIPAQLRSQDALVDLNAAALEARALLARVPAAPREAARKAVAAARRARALGIPEPEARALAALREARSRRQTLPLAPPTAHGDGALNDEHEASLWRWIEQVGAGCPPDEAALSLARLLSSRSGAERVFVLLLDDEGGIDDAWAVDLDGLPLNDAALRAPAPAARDAAASPSPLYQRSLPTAGGSGSRLSLAGPRPCGGHAALVLEHRFAPGRFDDLSPPLLARWRALASLLGRLDSPPAAPAARPATAPSPAALAPPALYAAPPRPAALDVATAQPISAPRRVFPSLIGQSEALSQALARLDLAVDSDLPALIVGETGTGKELFARALHDHGPRASGPFVAVNCAAIPDSLFEAELFGHARGSFTGAERARPGLIAAADGGTLFLDEIGELSLPRQASLLRVLQERSYRPVGGDAERPVKVRVVAATNRDLEAEVAAGSFRRDLLYRLDVLRIRVPPLRERAGDVQLLVEHFLARAGSLTKLSPAASAALAAHPWPGNIRELEHLVQRLAALRIDRVDLPHLPRELRASAPAPRPQPRGEHDERAEVEQALSSHDGNISHAARALGLTRHGLKKRMVRLGLREPAAAATKKP